MLWFWDALGTRTILWYGHGSSGSRMHSEHECYHVFGMDALVIAPTRNTNVIMAWACMLWLSYGTRTSKIAMRGIRSTYLGPSKHFECGFVATKATSQEVGQICIFCVFTLRRSQQQQQQQQQVQRRRQQNQVLATTPLGPHNTDTHTC